MNCNFSTVKSLIKRNLPILAVALVSVLVAAEVVLRLTVVDTWPPVTMKLDPADRNCFRPVPGSSMTFYKNGLLGEKTIHSVNKLGFRGAIPDSGNYIKIAFVGGGTVYGTGIDENRTLPAALEKAVRDRFPDTKIRVINLGFPGFNIEEQSNEYLRLLPLIKPDITLLAISDDYSGPSACSTAVLPVRNILHRYVALWSVFEKTIHGANVNVATNFSVPAQWHPVRVILDRFDSDNVHHYLIRMIQTPPVFQKNGDPTDFLKAATESGFDTIDLAEGISMGHNRTRFIAGPKTISPALTKAAAETIADRIAPGIRAIIKTGKKASVN